MTYLEILQRTAVLAGLSSPSTTVSQTGEIARLQIYIAQAYNEIQTSRENWRFMWARGEFETTADNPIYNPSGTSLDIVDPDSWTIYKTADGESTEAELEYETYLDFRANHMVGTLNSDTPTAVTILPNKNIRLAPPPDAVYKVQFDYYLTVDTLSGDTDEPRMPAKYHGLIVYDALKKFGQYEEAAQVIQYNILEHEQLFNDMLWTQLVEDEEPQVIVV